MSNDRDTNNPVTSDQTQLLLASPKKKDGLEDIFRFVIIALLIVVPVRVYIAQPFVVSGASMDPTFETGEYLIVDQLSYKFEEPERGDVVIFRFPQDPSKFFIKRIIGLPGEAIEIHGSTVSVHSKEKTAVVKLDEPYIDPNNVRTDSLSLVLADDEYFVLGDNRRASSDSRIWGPVKRSLIVGRAFIRLLPVSQIEILPGEYRYHDNGTQN